MWQRHASPTADDFCTTWFGICNWGFHHRRTAKFMQYNTDPR